MKKLVKQTLKRAGLTREALAAARMFGERNLMAAMPHRRARAGGRILCYHSIGQPSSGTNDVSPALFRRHIEMALERGYRFVPPQEIARTGGAPMDLALSFDDGGRTRGADHPGIRPALVALCRIGLEQPSDGLGP